MVLLKNFGNIFKIPELTKKILFTLGVLIVYRIGSFIPAIGINVSVLSDYMEKASVFSGLLRYFDTFSGGALQQCTLFALGIGPYINASIVMQILSMTLPSLEALSKEGDYGKRVINQYTRYLALVLSVAYSISYAGYLSNINATSAPGLLTMSGLSFTILFCLSLTVGSLFTMWLGEQIALFGVGGGSSIIIFAGIVARFPSMIIQLSQLHPLKAVLVILIFLAITASIVFLEKGNRKIPVQYARRIVGQRVYGGQSSYIPFKINNASIMPIIFASSLLNIPLFIINMVSQWLPSLKVVANALQYNGILYNSLEFGLIIFFTYFYTALAFNPTELAENIKKSGGFIPGIRPGKQTADYFDYILNRLGLVGAIYLGVLAIAPNLFGMAIGVPLIISGTSLLIMVGVALETSSQIEAYLIEHRYEGFLSTGRMKR